MGRRPFRTLRPRALSPLVLTCEHASSRLPSRFPSDGASRAVLGTHFGGDLGAWDLVRGLVARLGASAVGGAVSRLVVDLNREVDDPTLVLAAADGVPLPWNRSLSAAERERRVLAYHAPYHAEIERLLVRRLVRGVRPLLLAVHSFTPHLGRSRRDFDAGVLYAEHRTLGRLLVARLRAEGLDARHNRPYSGLAGMMYSAERHGSRHRIACLEIEVNQARLSTARGMRRVTRAIARALPPVVDQAGSQASPVPSPSVSV